MIKQKNKANKIEKVDRSVTTWVRENPWRASTIFLLIVFLIMVIAPLVQEKEAEKEYRENLVENLIENRIIFVYSSGCSACHTQIEIFGDDWSDYIQSGLTLDCATHSSQICNGVRVTPSWVVNNGTDFIVVGEGVING